MSEQQVREFGECQRKLPTEADVIAAFGENRIERKYRPDGNYSWRMRYQPNERGKLTNDARKVLELMGPHIKADTERHHRNQRRERREPLRDRNGGVNFVDESLADSVARRNGWSHVPSARVGRGYRAMTTFRGTLWKSGRGGWQPVSPAKRLRSGPIMGPDGNEWRWMLGAWRRTT